MGRRGRGRRKAATYETQRYRRKQIKKDKESAAITAEEVRPLPPVPPVPAPRVIYPRSDVPKHRLLLPRPEPGPPLQVASPSSSSNNPNVAGASSADPKIAPVKKIFILGPNSVLYEVLGSPPTASGSAPVDQKFVQIPNLSTHLPIPGLTPLKRCSTSEAQGPASKQSTSTTISVVESGPDTSVEEIQVKVELPDFICDEEIPSDGSDDDINSKDTKPEYDDSDEETVSADSAPSPSVKEELISEDEQEQEISPGMIKREEISVEDDPLVESQSQDQHYSNSNANEGENEQISSVLYPRKVPLRPNPTNSDDLMYCDECCQDFDDDCPKHGALNVVDDTPVTANINDKLRAKKTAPPLVSIADSDIPGVGSGVWARQVIPARTRFGPYDGKIVSTDVSTPLTWLIRLNGKPGYCIDAGEPGLSNWMRYVATARRPGEQNLRPFQRFGKLYFRTTRQVEPYEELLLGDDSLEKHHRHTKGFALKLTQECEESSTENPDSNSSQLMIVTVDLPMKCERDLVCDDETTEKAVYNSSNMLRATSAVNVEASAAARNQDFAEENLLSCTICKARFRHEETLNDHLRKHSLANQLECSVCSERFFDEESLRKHRDIHKSDDVRPSSIIQVAGRKSPEERRNRYVCTLCNTWFVYEESLKHHVLTHTKTNQFQCDQCSERFFDLRSLGTHLKIHKEVKMGCPVCDKEFQVRSSFNKHLAGHGEKPYSCVFCKERFTDQADFEQHQKSHPGSEQFVCHICHLVFMNRDLCKRHVASHQKGKVFACTVCEAWFANLQQLNGHLRVHKGVNSFECSHCSEIFSRESEYKEHLASHNLFECADCNRRFSQLSEWIVHRKSHVYGLPFKCALCDARFRCKPTLNKHIQLHQSQHKLVCKFCNEKFEELRFLRKHVRVDHADKFGLQTWKSWEAWKSQGSQTQSILPCFTATSSDRTSRKIFILQKVEDPTVENKLLQDMSERKGKR